MSMKTSQWTEKLKILCVDDDPYVVDCMRRHLRKYSVEIIEALNGLQGMSIAMSEKPDLIITDVRMPLADGKDLIDCIASNQLLEHVPIIALTGAREPSMEESLKALGASSVLFKPISAEQLIDEMRKFIPVSARG